MEWIDTNLLISICTCAIWLTQFVFWKHIAKQKSYESEKGKNLATKEDIGKITQEIKSVESIFNNKTEMLKATLNLQTNIETGLVSEKRNVIIELHASLQKWMHATLFIDFNCFDNNDICHNSIQMINNLYNDVLTKEAVFKIYIEDENLRSHIYNINNNATRCMSLTTRFLLLMILSNNKLKQLEIDNNDEESCVLHQKRAEAQANFHEEQINASNLLFKKINEFEDQCRTYISEYAKSIH